MGQVYGLSYHVNGVLSHPTLRSIVDPIQHTMLEWMHILAASGGLAQYRLNEVCKQLLQHNYLDAFSAVLTIRPKKQPDIWLLVRISARARGKQRRGVRRGCCRLCHKGKGYHWLANAVTFLGTTPRIINVYSQDARCFFTFSITCRYTRVADSGFPHHW